MPINQISTLLKFVNLQMAAEAIFDFDPQPEPNAVEPQRPGATIVDRSITPAELRVGNKRSSRFPTPLAEEFSRQFKIVEHISNTETGFSGTLFRYEGLDDESTGLKKNDKILSFRSTEFVDDAVRENQATNKGEIQKKGWAFGQIADMQSWYEKLVADPNKLGRAGEYYVTGYSLGAHLATAFRLMRHGDGSGARVKATYTFNGAGVGDIKDSNDSAATGRRLLEITNQFRSESGVDYRQPGNLRESSLRFSNVRVGSLYSDLRGIFNQRIDAFKERAALQDLMSQVIAAFNRRFPGSMRIGPSPTFLSSLILEESRLVESGRSLTGIALGEVRQILTAVDGIREIIIEGERVSRISNDGGLPPAQVPPYQVAGVRLDYQMAVINAAKSTAEYRTHAILSGYDGLSDNPEIKEFLPRFFDVAGATTPSSVSNSQWHYGQPIRVFIEDQPLTRGTAAWDIAVRSIGYIDSKLLVDEFSRNDFGDTHSLVLIVDSLSVAAAIATLDPTFTLSKMADLFRAAGNKKGKSSKTFGQQGFVTHPFSGLILHRY